jgi:hypothetical protein
LESTKLEASLGSRPQCTGTELVTKEDQIAMMMANRLMRSQAEATAFDQALLTFADALDVNKDVGHLRDLLLILDDASEHVEVMWSLHQLIWAFDPQAVIQAFAAVIPVLLQQAPEWVEIFHYRILADDSNHSYYKSLLPTLPITNQHVIPRALYAIAETEPDWQSRAQSVLT